MATDTLLSLDDLPPDPTPATVEEVKFRADDRLVQQHDLAEGRRLPENTRRDELRLAAARVLEADGATLSRADREALLDEVLDELVGLGPIDRLMRVPDGGDILVNGPHDVW